MTKKKIPAAFGFIALLCIAGCVTVNVYFPAAQVEKVADEIVRDVYAGNPDAPLPEELAVKSEPVDEAQTAPEDIEEAVQAEDTATETDAEDTDSGISTERDLNGDNTRTSRLLAILEFFGPTPAHADATSVSNAAIRGLRGQIAAAHQKLLPYYKAGNIGINNAGLLEIRRTSGLPIAELAKLKKLVNQDNAARRAMYQEVATAMNIPSGQVVKVQKSFADQWREEAPAGWMIQTDTGAWQTK